MPDDRKREPGLGSTESDEPKPVRDTNDSPKPMQPEVPDPSEVPPPGSDKAPPQPAPRS